MRILMNNFYLIIGKSMRNMNKIINKALSKQNIKDINKNENDTFKGEIALWKAVILQALIDLQSQSKKKIATTYRIKALMWFNLKNQDFIIQDGGDINCNIDVQTDTNMYRTANINMIDKIQENGDREEQDYSIVIYIVKKGDTLWNIAKEFGSTVDGIARVNGIENRDLIMPGQKLYIPKFERISERA